MMMATAMSLASFPTSVIDQHHRSGSWREFLRRFELAIDIVKTIFGNALEEFLRLNLFLRYISKDGNIILESKGSDRSLFGHNDSKAVNTLNSHFSSAESI